MARQGVSCLSHQDNSDSTGSGGSIRADEPRYDEDRQRVRGNRNQRTSLRKLLPPENLLDARITPNVRTKKICIFEKKSP